MQMQDIQFRENVWSGPAGELERLPVPTVEWTTNESGIIRDGRKRRQKKDNG